MHLNLRPVWGILPVRSQWSYSCSFGGATAQAEREAAAKATRRARAEAAEEQEVLRKQVWDWKIRPGRGNFECLRRELATAEGEAGRLCELIAATATAEGWAPATCEATSGSKVLVELGSDAIKGVCTNDFILAAKIDMNEEAMGMLVKEAPKARNWF